MGTGGRCAAGPLRDTQYWAPEAPAVLAYRFGLGAFLERRIEPASHRIGATRRSVDDYLAKEEVSKSKAATLRDRPRALPPCAWRSRRDCAGERAPRRPLLLDTADRALSVRSVIAMARLAYRTASSSASAPGPPREAEHCQLGGPMRTSALEPKGVRSGATGAADPPLPRGACGWYRFFHRCFWRGDNIQVATRDIDKVAYFGRPKSDRASQRPRAAMSLFHAYAGLVGYSACVALVALRTR